MKRIDTGKPVEKFLIVVTPVKGEFREPFDQIMAENYESVVNPIDQLECLLGGLQFALSHFQGEMYLTDKKFLVPEPKDCPDDLPATEMKIEIDFANAANIEFLKKVMAGDRQPKDQRGVEIAGDIPRDIPKYIMYQPGAGYYLR